MKSRRDFITLVGGAAAAWPMGARAQQQAVPVVGFLDSRSPGDADDIVPAFRAGLNEAGYIEGRDVKIDQRWAEGRYDRLPTLAADLVRRQVAVLLAGGPSAAQAARSATSATPVVFIASPDPVKTGLVASLNRPGGNTTGFFLFSGQLEPKKLELLHEVAPKAQRIGALVNPTNANNEVQSASLSSAARALGLEVIFVRASTAGEIDAAFADFVQQKSEAVFIGNDPFFTDRREQIVTLAARHALPAVYTQRQAALAGGLMSYGSSITDAYHQMGVYTGRILKGVKPANLPVLQPTKFVLAINLKTAKSLGLTVPSTLLVAADEVIE
jgi:putative ABC transport system substrate-binding protein